MICINCSKQIINTSPVIDVCAACFERRAQCVDRYYAALTEWRQITGSLGRPGLPPSKLALVEFDLSKTDAENGVLQPVDPAEFQKRCQEPHFPHNAD